MEFRTPVRPLPFAGTISHSTPLLMLGSCFSDNIGSRLADRLFSVEINPTGQLYNPESIATTAELLAGDRLFTTDDLVSRDGKMWHSFSHHTRFSGSDPDAVIARINSSLENARSFLRGASVAVITLGSRRCYRLKPTGKAVANCHKFPSSCFEIADLSADECASLIGKATAALRSVSPGLRVILTVSPIRHIADGLHANALSKATLLLAAEEAAEADPDTIYFPAFETMTDDLRDYRFYDADMIHPSATAADYIYELFAQSFFSSKTIALARQSLNFAKFLRHRPLTADSAAEHAAAIARQASKLKEIAPELAPAIKKLIENETRH